MSEAPEEDAYRALIEDIESSFDHHHAEQRIMADKEQVYRERGIPYFKCPDCGAVSPSPKDIENNYCFRCHAFKGDR